MLDETFEAGDILVGDALYTTWFLLAEMQARGVDILFEQNGSRRRCTDFRKGHKLGSRDHLISLPKPQKRPDWMTAEQYAAFPDTIVVREFKAGKRILVTTMLCPESASKDELSKLYKCRWSIELDLRAIKSVLGMDTLTCKTPEMVEKEIWVYLLAYNLIRMLMMYSARTADRVPRTLSFRHTVQICLAWWRYRLACHEVDLLNLRSEIAAKRVGNHAGRIEPRAVKRRPGNMPALTKTRAKAQREVRRHGHPRKH